MLLAGIHVRPQHFDFQVPTFREIADQLILVAHIGRHEGRHELSRVVGFQIGCLIADDGIRGCMRFIEAISRELLDQLIELLRFLLRNLLLCRALDKLDA